MVLNSFSSLIIITEKLVSYSLPTNRVLDDFILMMQVAKIVNHINLVITSGTFLY